MAKFMLWIAMTVGGTGGSFVPLLWGSRDLGASVLFSTIGGILGIWVWYRWLRYT